MKLKAVVPNGIDNFASLSVFSYGKCWIKNLWRLTLTYTSSLHVFDVSIFLGVLGIR